MKDKALPIAIALTVGGGALLYFGYQGYQSAQGTFSKLVGGRPPNDVIAMLVIGGVLAIVGLGMLGKSLKK